MSKSRKIGQKTIEITIILIDNGDFISLIDVIFCCNEGSELIGKWICNKSTLEYLVVQSAAYKALMSMRKL